MRCTAQIENGVPTGAGDDHQQQFRTQDNLGASVTNMD